MRRGAAQKVYGQKVYGKNSGRIFEMRERDAAGRAKRERQSLIFGDTTIVYLLRRSERRKKTVEISVDGEGVHVAAPATASDDEVQEIVRKKARWILSRSSEAQRAAEPNRFVSGETLPYLGRDVLLEVSAADVRRAEVCFDNWRFIISVPKGLRGCERVERIRGEIVAWYRARAAERMERDAVRWLPKFDHGRKPRILPRILIRDQKRRWGSCAADGTLRFNWRLMMLDPSLIEYVVVHELAHLDVRNHSKDFWDLVASVMPDVQQRKRRLRETGSKLPL